MAIEWNVEILQSDWSIFKILDSDWLSVILAHFTTDDGNELVSTWALSS